MKAIESVYNCKSMNMIVELINTCNLKCTYCFEKCQDERIAKIMPVEVLEKAIDFLVSKRENCHLTFFGGEPTLCRELIAKGIEYGNKLAREKNPTSHILLLQTEQF